jgi:hypothetical protein
MHLQTVLSFLLVQCVLGNPQMPSKGTPKGTAKGSPKSSGSSGGLAGMAAAMGFDPNSSITEMVCQTFDGKNKLGSSIGAAFGSPNGVGPDEQCMVDRSGGSGPYKANYTEDATLPDHTIYAPLTPPPADVKLPVIIWGNGFCMAAGTMFGNFLNEIASHGFVIVANGPVKTGSMSQTTYKDLIKGLDWVTTDPAAKKYGNLDLTKIAVAGQSCGGLEAVSLSYILPSR